MRLLFIWLLNTIAVLATAYLLPAVSVEDFTTALIVALVLGVINVTLKPILVLLTLPVNFLTLGLFTLVINAVLIMFADSLVDGFYVAGFISAVLFSLVLGVFNGILSVFK